MKDAQKPAATSPVFDRFGSPGYVGAVATQQALRYHFGLTLRYGAGLAQINPRTFAGHVYAKEGSKCKPWGQRPAEQQAQAIKQAQQLIDKANAN